MHRYLLEEFYKNFACISRESFLEFNVGKDVEFKLVFGVFEILGVRLREALVAKHKLSEA